MLRIILSCFVIAAYLVLSVFVIDITSVTAAILTVDTLDDEQTINGKCSLREAVTNVNGGDQSGSTDCIAGDPSAADTITFSVTGTIVLVGLLPNVAQDLTVDGPGTDSLTISGNNSVRVIRISSGVTATLQDLTISAGMVSGTGGGGVYNQGDLTISNCVISNNQDSGGSGGGIFNDGGGVLTIGDSLISGNSSTYGGGIYNIGTVIIERSTMSGNTATDWGGAFFNNSSASFTNVTISGNQASWAAVLTQPGTTNSFTNCTIADNQSTGSTAGIAGNGFSNHNIRNTILSNNINTNYGSDNCYQVQNSLGYNISSDGTCYSFNQTGDMQNTDPLLGPLQDNGGPTFTHALLEGSPAVDAGDPANCPATDQRGIARPADGDKNGDAVCDIGSFEMEKSSSFPWTMFLPAITNNTQQ